jgi:hypothetical protein
MDDITFWILGWVLPWFLPGAETRIPNARLIVMREMYKLEAEAEAEAKAKSDKSLSKSEN